MPNKDISVESGIVADLFVKEREYWLNKLSGELAWSNFPYDYQAKDNTGDTVDKVNFKIEGDVQVRLEKLVSGSNSKLNIVLMTALAILLFKYSGNQDIIIGTPIDKQKIDANFINTVLALRNRISDTMTFKELLLQIRQNIIEAIENQNYPFDALVTQLNLKYEEKVSPLFDVALLVENIQDRGYLRGVNPGIIFSFLRKGNGTDGVGGVDGVVEYNSQSYEKTTVKRLIAHFIRVLGTALANVDAPLSDIHVLSGDEKKRLIYDFNDTASDYPWNKPVYALFEEQAGKTPGHTAVEYGNKNWSFGELNDKKNRLAELLGMKGVTIGSIVGIMASRSLEVVAAILGVLKAGGAYLPIDTEYPENRKKYILEDSGTTLLLTDRNLPGNLNWKGEIIDITDWDIGVEECNLNGLENMHVQPVEPTDLAYIIYTSGSTGKPKGVMIEHRALVNYLWWAAGSYVKNRNTVSANFPLYTSISFDLTVTSIFTPLITGGKIIIYGDEIDVPIEKILKENKVGIVKLTPTHLKLIANNDGSHSRIDCFIVGGEELETRLAREIHNIFEGKVEIYNEYGPTEATVGCMIYRFNPAVDKSISVPIGVPSANVRLYILDKNREPVPVGVTGEIYISGDGLARGYLNRPGLTAERFTINPFEPSQRLYGTGDLGRFTTDGNIQFKGRKDNQVKIRGHRIELGEIENKLTRHNEIKDALVTVKENENGDTYLCAYVVLKKELDLAEIREYVSGELPDYMIPSYFVNIEKIPLNPHGKVDRGALPDPLGTGMKENTPYIPPRDLIEKLITEVWEKVLGREKISVNENFFMLGGDSIKSIQIISRINSAGYELRMRDLFQYPVISDLALRIKEVEPIPTQTPVEKKEYYMLSSAQKRLYILQQMDKDSTAYNIPSIMILEGIVDKDKLELAIRGLIRRHESLRTSIEAIEEEPVQRIHDRVEFEIEQLEFRDQEPGVIRGDPTWSPEQTNEPIFKTFIRAFDLSKAPLLRVGLVKLKEEKYLFLVDMHHIISDGMSSQVLVQDFSALYAGQELPEIKLQYKDYAEWQNREKVNKKILEQGEYWKKEFAGEIPIMELPADYVRPAVQGFEGNTIDFELDGETAGVLKALVLATGSTLYIVLLALYAVFLAKLSNREDIVIGSPVFGRRHADLEKIIGMFVNTLAFRNYPAGEKKFIDFLGEVKEIALKGFENQEYQYEDLVEKVAVTRDVSRNPLFDTMFALQNTGSQKIEIAGLKLVPYEYENRVSKFDLSLIGVEVEEKLFFTFEYSTKLFKRETIGRFIVYFKNIVRSIVENKERRISHLEILTEEEKNRILFEFNDTETGYPKYKTIHQLFEEEAARAGDRIAVVARETSEKHERFSGRPISLSYRQLNEQSNRLAYLLIEKGVLPDNIVGIMLEQSLEMIVSILGILKAGGAYLSIEPEHPEERINYMLADSNAKILLGMEEYPKKIIVNCQLLIVNCKLISPPQALFHHSALIVHHSNLAYIIYTSGSTGRPKGVLIQHYNIANQLCGLTGKYTFPPTLRHILMAPFTFDPSVQQVFLPLITGGTLYTIPTNDKNNPAILLKFITDNDIKLLNTVPSVVEMLVDYIGVYKGLPLEYLILAGELFSGPLYQKITENLEAKVIINIYGPTEATINTTLYHCRPGDSGTSVPIGTPLPNYNVFLVDKYMNPQPLAVNGEILIGGEGVARGYLNNPELTAEKFIAFHHSSLIVHHSKLYRTGDLGRWLLDGNIEFLGRIDHQVKIRGGRVELGEIENRLMNHPGVKEAVVLGQKEASGDKYLCAYIVPNRELVISELREYLSMELPDYMIPSYFIQMEKIPLTTNGKIDRSALPKPELKAGESYTAPGNEIEKKLVELWSEILGRDELHASRLQTSIGIDDNFFQLGGHSLKATILVSKIHKAFDVKVPVVEIFKMPRVRQLAEYIKRKSKEFHVSIEPVEEKEYYLLSSAQKRLFILQQMNPGSIAYNMPEIISLSAEFDLGKIEETFKMLIKRHESLRTSFHVIGDQPLQKIHPEVNFNLDLHNLHDSHDSQNFIKRFIRPFDLAKAPLIRSGLIKEEGNRHIFIVDMHHIISDGVSHEILVKDFLALHEREELLPLRIHYKDFSEWQHGEKEKKNLKRQEKYWLKEFEGEPPVLDLPSDYPRPVSRSFEGDIINFGVSVEETRHLKAVALTGGSTLFMVLAAAVNILLSKLSGQEEIIIGAPVAGRRHADLEKIIGMFVNTLALRNYPVGEKTFKNFFNELSDRTLGAFENQEYQFEDLVEKVLVNRDMGRNPLFDVMFVLQNFSMRPADQGKNEVPGPGQPIKFDLTIVAVDDAGKLGFSFQYCTKLFKKETIERFIIYFREIVSSIVKEPGIRLSKIEVISEAEKKLILNGFNKTGAAYLEDMVIHQLFEKQVERTPDNIALVGAPLCDQPISDYHHSDVTHLTYRELNHQSNRLAGFLIEKGVLPDSIVGIIGERLLEMIIGIMGILKSSSAYLPIDPDYPEERKQYMLKDSAAKILLTANEIASLSTECVFNSHHSSFTGHHSNHLAYLIYTSGSTGKPKGVMVEHRSMVNLCGGHNNYYSITPWDRATKYAGFGFDASVWEIFPYLITGASLYIVPEEIILDIEALNGYYEKSGITIGFLPTQICEQFLALNNKSLRVLLTGGDKLKNYVRKNYRLYNNYGPTENTVVTTSFCVTGESGNIPIGKPVANNQVYILDRYNYLQPVGVPGELCIGGEGVARGYLNNPELTAEKFVINHLSVVIRSSKRVSKSANDRLYKTGDLARWLLDGNIEFLGRIDHQVKVRGFRVELGEIENRLSNHPGIKEAVVLTREDQGGDKYLCAYLVSEEKFAIAEIRGYLSKELPDYMIPSYFVPLEKIPLTSNGKIDRGALPKPELNVGESYTAPRNKIERKLVGLWANVLNIPPDVISIDRNFFELGGHSLKATVLASGIHKELNVILPLAELFKSPTIRGLSEYIKRTVEDIYESIMPVEEKEYYGLSFAQKRMYILQQIDLNGTAYNMPEIIPLPEEIDIDRLEGVFKNLIKRHDSLRTSFHMIGDQPLQKVHKDVPFKINSLEGRDQGAGLPFIRPFDLAQAPLLRVGLVRPEAEKHLLIVDIHHIISDGISLQVLKEDFMAFAEGKKLPPLRLQYKDFAQWQNSRNEVERLHRQMLYWLKEFEGEIPVLEIPLDYPRPMIRSFAGDSIDFEISAEETRSLNKMAIQGRATLFMVLAAAVNILLSKISGQEEIIIGTPIAGRRHPDLEKIIGMFINTLALRNYPRGDRTFKEFLADIKERVLMIFENQEYPFEALVEKLSLNKDLGRNPLFDVMFALQNMNTDSHNENEEIPYETFQPIQPDLPRRYENIARTAKFDLTLTAIEIEQKTLFSIPYCTKLFKKETIERFICYFKKIVASIINDPDIKLQYIDMVSKKEKEQLLVDFNNTGEIYSINKTIHQLFEGQVEQTPDRIAIVGLEGEANKRRSEEEKKVGVMHLTYNELNEKSGRLAGFLIEKGLLADDIVGIMIERSLEMIVGLLGILKSGGAYLPLNPKNPSSLTQYMLKDSSAKLLVTTNNKEGETVENWEGEKIFLEEISKSLKSSTHPLTLLPSSLQNSSNLAYIIYTSGSTGNPKGVPITHSNFSPLVHWGYHYMAISPTDRILQNLSYFFDWSVWEIFLTLTTGASLYIAREEVLLDGEALGQFMCENKITMLHITPSQFQVLVGVESDGKPVKLTSLKHLCLGAEKLTYDLVKRSIEMVPDDCRIFNMYGPTEATIIASVLEIKRTTVDKYETYGSIPIGIPVGNTRLYVLDKYFNYCPLNVTGELYIGGDGLSKGYIDNAELTAEKFIYFGHHSPITTHQSPLTLYKTGDLGRWLPDGVVEFLGRIDSQVKIRGFRIDLGEIENKLLEHEQVKSAVVTVTDEKNLYAYIVPEGQIGNEIEFKKNVKEYLTGQLPGYMVPSFIALIKNISLTPNGKVDLRALPQLEMVSFEKYLAPRNIMEEKLEQIWVEVLGKDAVKDKDHIGIDANFFELGGHSLKATVLAFRIHKEWHVKLPLAELFKTPTIRGLSEYIRGMAEEIYESIMPVEEKEYYRLSFAQQRMYFLQQINLNGTAYNIPEIIPLAGEVDLDRLEGTFRKLIKRHDSLRTSFHMIGDQPVQEVHNEVDFKIEDYNIAVKSANEFDEEQIHHSSPIIHHFIHSFIRPFDLAQVPLLRVGALKTIEGRNYLLVDMHHIISDGVSHEVLVKDFLALNDGKVLPPLRIQYKDFAQWQNSQKETNRIHQQVEYWLKEFEGEIPVLEIPTDYPRPKIQSFAGNNIDFEISAEETRDLNAVALNGEATLFMVLAAAVNILLSKLSGQEVIIIGTPIAGRRHSDLEKIIGMFVNTLALRNYPRGDRTFKEFLADLKERVLIFFENQEYPFEALVDKLSLKRDMGRNPLFDVMFALQNMNTDSNNENEETPSVTYHPVQPDFSRGHEDIVRAAKFDLTFTAVEIGQKTLFSTRYCTKLFKKETIEGFIGYFKKIVSIVVKEPGIKISDIEIISEEEKRQILYVFNDTGARYPKDKTIHQLFKEQVEKTPERVALVGAAEGEAKKRRKEEEKRDGIHLSYRELNEKSGQLAGLLIEKGVVPDTIVGIMMERSVEMIIGLIGILKSGGAYLPIDPDYPQERIEYMLKDSGAKLLVTANDKEGEKVLLEKISRSPKSSSYLLAFSPSYLLNSSNLAYIIYTSGTTGQPKGTLIEHRNVVRLLFNDKFQFDFSNRDVWTFFHSFCFDFSVWEMYGALLYGGKLLIVPKMVVRDTVEFLEFLKKETVTVLNQTPPAFYNLINEDLNSRQTGKKLYLKYVIFGGEALNPLKLKDWQKKYPQTRLINMFGITETTVHVTYKEIYEKDIKLNISNIGKPIPTLSTYLLDKYQNPVSIGVMGEIYVGGDGVARGYLNQVELTDGKFIENPYRLGDRLYRSGDTGRFLENGDLEYLGRIDRQVKIRGFRIELGEIQNQLLKYEGIKDAVVLAEETPDEKYLCAYIVSVKEFTLTELRTHLAGKLPDYMIPSYFVRLEKIPLTPNGKVDRKALPKPELNAGDSYTAPGNEVEKKLVGLWADVLNIQPDVIGIDRNFFELGGHSLKATIMASRIHKELNVIVPLGEIFNAPTIRDLGEYIRNAESNIQSDIDRNLVLIKEGLPGDNHLFFIHDGTGEVEGYVEFCKHLTNNFNCWGIRADRLENLAPLNVTIRELAEKYIGSMKKIQPHGPYYIAGWSLGGTIAFEMVVQLEQTNEDIAFLGLIDSPPPYKNLWKDAAQLNKDSIFNTNLSRALLHARALYKPAGKIHTPVHYIAASQSKGFKKEHWKKYSGGGINYYETAGDHYSIFKMPQVIDLAKIFPKILQKISSMD